MKVPRLREPGHLHYVNQRERFNKQVAVNYATLLRFYDVPRQGINLRLGATRACGYANTTSISATGGYGNLVRVGPRTHHHHILIMIRAG